MRSIAAASMRIAGDPVRVAIGRLGQDRHHTLPTLRTSRPSGRGRSRIVRLPVAWVTTTAPSSVTKAKTTRREGERAGEQRTRSRAADQGEERLR